MPDRPSIPAPGTPISPAGEPGSLRDVLQQLREASANQNSAAGIGGIVSRTGTDLTPPQGLSIALFQLTGPFAAGPPSPTWATAPANNWFSAPATRVEYYPASAEWAIP